jgi:hypothetical protein
MHSRCAVLDHWSFVNGDVLVIDRLARPVPGIAGPNRPVARFGSFATLHRPFRRTGLQVVGAAIKDVGP